ncbi:non-homologous end-joining DNA ligase [Desulfotomaculum copahuensis]|uniref:DNA ligase (ATP) n=1 Tax=Desulfotomaculum copahuensis TaxID=1838280 RepID=A0A1B7LFU3_9FIRM|nr:non-homologous end-joining DNA ligase [Desulfotomaculum copahuensis]OAT83579.1 ATP-dependent DNA ligase [Desulfotomaculum copahuensis]
MITAGSLPLFKPMLAVSAAPFDHPEYLYEVKWDGYRALAYLDGDTRLYSRNRRELTAAFPELTGLHRFVDGQAAILDGEIIVPVDGLPSFNALQSRGRLTDPLKIRRLARESPALYVVFDLLYMHGRSVMDEPLIRRRELLAAILIPGAPAVVSDFVTGDGCAFMAACVSRGLEGVVAKALYGPYRPGMRSRYWCKFRHTREADLIICGYQPGRGGRQLGALVLGGCREGRLVYAGKVGTGFDRAEEGRLLAVLNPLAVPRPLLSLPARESRRTRWVKPVLVCVVEYLALTAEGLLRHPVYRGLRCDKDWPECTPPA